MQSSTENSNHCSTKGIGFQYSMTCFSTWSQCRRISGGMWLQTFRVWGRGYCPSEKVYTQYFFPLFGLFVLKLSLPLVWTRIAVHWDITQYCMPTCASWSCFDGSWGTRWRQKSTLDFISHHAFGRHLPKHFVCIFLEALFRQTWTLIVFQVFRFMCALSCFCFETSWTCDSNGEV